MKTAVLIAFLSVLAIQTPKPVDAMIERLATCQDSWRDWKDDPVQTKKMAELFNTAFVRHRPRACREGARQAARSVRER